MNNEISISMLWRIFKNSWKKMVIITLAAMVLMGLFTHFLIKKQYSSSVKFYVVNASVNDEYISQSLLSATAQLSNDYIQIITSDVMMKPLVELVNEEFGTDYTQTKLTKMIHSSVVNDASMFTIKVTNGDNELAYFIADYIAENAPEAVKEVTKPWLYEEEGIDDLTKKDVTECMSVISQPKVAVDHDSPSLTMNVAIAGIVAAVLVYAVYFLIALFDTVIKTEEDLKMFTGKYPLIGTIPTWVEK